MGQVTVFSGAERRRRWSDADKRALVEAAFAPGAVVSEVARGADVAASQIYRWRKQFAPERVADFAAVIVAPGEGAQGAPARGPTPAAALVIEIGGAVVRIAADAPPRLVTAVLRSLGS